MLSWGLRFPVQVFPEIRREAFELDRYLGRYLDRCVPHPRKRLRSEPHAKRLAGTPQTEWIHPRCLPELELHSILPDAHG